MPLPIPFARQRSRHLVASAASFSRSDVETNQRRSMTWQRRALAYIDMVPELSYSSRFYARMLKQLRIYAATVDDQGKETEATGLPAELLDRIVDKAGGKRQILGNYGRLMFATGEGLLCGFDLGQENEFWNFLWNDEIVVEKDGDGTVRKVIWRPMGGQGTPREYGPEEAVVYRMWTAHPRLSGEAESPMRSSLDVAEELVILTSAVRATAVSRTLNGLLVIPSELSPPTLPEAVDEDPEADPFMADFVTHLEAQIENAGTAGAAAPYVLWGTYEYLDKIRKIDLHDPQTDYMELGLRKEAIERLARGFDFPPEVLQGLGITNHWAALQIVYDMWRNHGAPIAAQFCDDLNDAYLRPTLQEQGYADWQNIQICFDESEILARPDRSDDADKAADRGYISAEGYRTLKNIPEDFAPSQDEHDEYLAIKLKDPAIIGEPPVAGTPAVNQDASQGPPPPGPEGDSGRQTRVVASQRELGAAEMAIARCRELAGIRIRQKEKVCPECLAMVNGQPNAALAAAVGADTLIRMALTPQTLVRGGADTLRQVLPIWGYTDAQTTALSEMIENYAARTLFEVHQPVLPVGFAAHFERAKEVD